MNSWEIIGNVGDSVYTAIMANDNPRGADFDPVPDYYEPEITRQALISLEGLSSTPGTIADVPYSYIIQYPTMSAVANHPGYFLLESSSQQYHYLYVGKDWVYRYEGGSNLNIYMDQCYPAANSVIEVSYGPQATDWTQTTPIT
jgi:hypothetical protein